MRSACLRLVGAAILSCLMLQIAHAASLWTNETDTQWGSTAVVSCTTSNNHGDVVLQLFLDQERPDVVTLYLLAPVGQPPLPVMATSVTATFSDGVTLQAPARFRRNALDLTEMMAVLMSDVLPSWMHELTSTASVSLSFGTGRVRVIDLAGSSNAVDGLERCVRAHRFVGVPPPFKAATDARGVVPTGCFRFGQTVTLQGTLAFGRGPEGDEPEVALARPICVDRAFGDGPAMNVQLVNYDVGPAASPNQGRKGSPLRLTGTLDAPVSQYDLTPVILKLP